MQHRGQPVACGEDDWLDEGCIDATIHRGMASDCGGTSAIQLSHSYCPAQRSGESVCVCVCNVCMCVHVCVCTCVHVCVCTCVMYVCVCMLCV